MSAPRRYPDEPSERGWTRITSQKFSGPSGWGTKCLVCAASTAISVTPFGPSSKQHGKSAGQPHSVNELGWHRAQSCLSRTPGERGPRCEEASNRWETIWRLPRNQQGIAQPGI